MTLKDWLAIVLDLDAYIAKGGRLADLPLPPLQNMPAQALEMIAEQMGAEKILHALRYGPGGRLGIHRG
jgi:hypothetical protein